MSFYTTDKSERTVYAFPRKALRDYMTEHAAMEACTSKHAYLVRQCEEDGLSNYNFIDMSIGEYWDGELAPLWDETHDLCLW